MRDKVVLVTGGGQGIGRAIAQLLTEHGAIVAIADVDAQAGRVGRPEDVAEIVAYLLSDEAGFVTGQNFVVDGGMARKMIYV